MIGFNCACGHRFNLTDDRAGESLQCPRCMRLVSVPHLDELASMEPDGTFKMSDPVVPPDPHHLDHAAQAFTRATRDERGEPIDLRPGVAAVLAAGVVGIPEATSSDSLPGPPAYDPFTGELIRPVELKQEPDNTPPQAIPLAKPALSYATHRTPGEVAPSGHGLAWILLRLFHPANFIVWMLVGFVHAANLFMIPLPLIGLIYTFVFALPVTLFLIAHLGNVIEDTGPQEADELPVPLRSASISDDIWRPFVNVGIAVLLAIAPTVLLRIVWSDAPTPAWWAAAGIFYVTLPALVLTSTSSGALNNLLPHRALGVIPACGIAYLVAAVLLFVGIEGLLASSQMMMSVGRRAGAWMFAGAGAAAIQPVFPKMTPLLENLVALPTVLVSMYVLHAAAWFLGLLYRNHHHEFPWVLQHHISTRTDTIKQLEQMRQERARQQPADAGTSHRV
jgi:hypothetical protein